jgi:uncharacterized membrane protein
MKLKQLASAVILATSAVTAVAVSPLATAATYDLTLTPVQDKSFFNFAQSIDNTGTMVVVNESEFNPPIDLSILDFESETFTSLFEDPEAVEQGVFSNADYQALYAYVVNGRSGSSGINILIQSLATYRSYQGDTVTADLIPGFDVIDETFEDYTRSAYSQVNDSVSGNYFVGAGSTPFFKVDYTDEDGDEFTYIVNDTLTQAFVEANGVTTALPPTMPSDTGINGFSEAFAINESLQVAGWGSVSLTEDYQTDIDECLDDETRGDTPVELCIYNLTRSITAGSYRRAVTWQLDAQGNVLSSTQYGMVFEPEEDEDSIGYTSTARGINNNGIAVGSSHTGERVIYTLPGGRAAYYANIVAATFANGETTELLPREENLSSSAIDINDDSWVVGTVLRENNGVARNQMFIYNIDSGEAEYPQGFFQTAAVTPRAINNNGIIVGEGEYESDVQTNRQLRAFMYDINVGEFVDLNTLLSCEQREQYTLVSAMDINDNDEIIANARYISTQRYITGEEVLTDAGDTVETDRVVAVKLTPNSTGSIEQCESVEEEPYERQGASASWYGIALLSLLAVFRRRVKNK